MREKALVGSELVRRGEKKMTISVALILGVLHSRDMDSTTTNPAAETTETVAARIERLALTDISDSRLKTLTIAHPSVNDATFAMISNALRVSRKSTTILPSHRFENLSRGRGWARQGRGSDVSWGERTDGGYRVGPGKWVVGGNDGFSRKGQVEWTVAHVMVGGAVWTIAN